MLRPAHEQRYDAIHKSGLRCVNRTIASRNESSKKLESWLLLNYRLIWYQFLFFINSTRGIITIQNNIISVVNYFPIRIFHV